MTFVLIREEGYIRLGNREKESCSTLGKYFENVFKPNYSIKNKFQPNRLILRGFMEVLFSVLLEITQKYATIFFKTF